PQTGPRIGLERTHLAAIFESMADSVLGPRDAFQPPGRPQAIVTDGPPMMTRNGLNAAYEFPLTDSRDEQTATQPAAEPEQPAAEPDDMMTAAGQGHESADAEPPPDLDIGSTQDALRTQLNELVQALSDKVEAEPADEADDFQD